MKKTGLIALAALLTIALVGATIGASASASKGGAVAAKKKKKKKKCPAGTHKVVKIKKKNGKKIKKIKCVPNSTTGTTGSPLVRATLTWSGGGDNTEYDLYAFLSGTTASVRTPAGTIPQTTFSPIVQGSSGTETFTDLTFAVPGRNFDFGVCKQDGSNDGSTYNIDWVTADGMHHTDSHTGAGDGYAVKYSGSTIIPNKAFTPCPAP
jgi:hypothetical protein